MKESIFVAPVAVLNFNIEEEYDEVTILFGEFSSCDIYGLNAKKVKFIGCSLGEGLIENSRIDTISFRNCYQVRGTKLDLSISEIREVKVFNSFINIVHPIGNQTQYEIEGEFHNDLEIAFKPFGYPYDDISQADLDRVIHLLGNYPYDKIITYNSSVWVLNHEEETGRTFLPILLDRVMRLPEEEQDYFKQYFKYLLADEYQYLRENEKAMAFI